MTVCPNCGFIKRDHWRQNRWRTNVYFLKYLEHPEDMNKDLLQELLDGHAVALDKYYAYRKCGKVIERILRVDYEVGGLKAFHIPREKPRSVDPWQQKISKKA